MQEILDLIEKYIENQNLFWSDEQCPEEIGMDEKTYDWMKKEWALIDEIDSIKKQILDLIKGDRTLFNLYLKLGSCIKYEEYEQAETFKNEILSYGKAA